MHWYICLFFASVSAWDVARTPPLGFNTWNKFGCSVTGQILMDTARAMVDSGLAATGYVYVNSDDCWMLLNRTADGRQIANPDKFPNGFKSVADFIHSLGLKSGLYTAKGPTTCAGFAASCDHEIEDAAQWAEWGIDYVKDDSCSSCAGFTDNEIYSRMWRAIQASGRPMVLTVEGDPDDATITHGGYGNAKRVGHDISPFWMSMVSLVDIGSGLWPYAHNSSNATVGGWWNDLDMVEVGNAPDFNCSTDAAALARCQAHMTMWTIMKAPLILGNDIPAMDAATKAVLANTEALAVNQDAWGLQARRVAVQEPRNSSLTASPSDNIAVIARCSPAEPTQKWTFVNSSSSARDGLYLAPCNPADPFQQWQLAGGALRDVGANACVDSSGRSDPGQVLPCVAGAPSQQWAFVPATGQVRQGGHCLDVFDFSGPDVFFGGCKAPTDPSISNQVFVPPDASGLIRSMDAGAPPNSCLSVSAGPPGGTLQTTDAAGATWCLHNHGGAEGMWGGVSCPTGPDRGGTFNPTPNAAGLLDIGKSNYNNQQGASGPWPHTRYVQGGWSWAGNAFVWRANLSIPASPIAASDTTGILDDDLVGGVTRGGAFCLQLTTGGMLEVWAGALSGGRWAVALFNRSPSDDVIALKWADVGLAPGAAFAVRDIWGVRDLGTFSSDFSRPVPAHATVYLVLTPA